MAPWTAFWSAIDSPSSRRAAACCWRWRHRASGRGSGSRAELLRLHAAALDDVGEVLALQVDLGAHRGRIEIGRLDAALVEPVEHVGRLQRLLDRLGHPGHD